MNIESKGVNPNKHHEPKNFIVSTFFRLSDELERRQPSDEVSPIEAIKNEPLLSAELFLLSAPFTVAFWSEFFIVGMAKTANDILKALPDAILDAQFKHHNQQDL